LLLLLALCCFSGQGIFMYAQEWDEEREQEREDEWENEWGEDPEYDDFLPIASEWDSYRPDGYRRGDQMFTLSLGAAFPVFFANENREVIKNNFTPPIGGAIGPLVYSYFFNKIFFVGGEIAFNINSTLGRNMLFMIPIGLRTGVQFNYRHFEFPISLTAGVALHRNLNYNYVGMFLKGGVSAFYRFSPEWSFGLNTDWTWFPQWIRDEDGNIDKAKSVHGNFTGISFSARYHF